MSDGYLIMRTPVDNNNAVNNLLTIINKKATITTTQQKTKGYYNRKDIKEIPLCVICL